MANIDRKAVDAKHKAASLRNMAMNQDIIAWENEQKRKQLRLYQKEMKSDPK